MSSNISTSTVSGQRLNAAGSKNHLCTNILCLKPSTPMRKKITMSQLGTASPSSSCTKGRLLREEPRATTVSLTGSCLTTTLTVCSLTWPCQPISSAPKNTSKKSTSATTSKSSLRREDSLTGLTNSSSRTVSTEAASLTAKIVSQNPVHLQFLFPAILVISQV